MRLSCKPIQLDLIHNFKIARSADSHKQNVLVYLEDSRDVGVGEAAPSAYYGESQSGVMDVLGGCLDVPVEDSLDLEQMDQWLLDSMAGSAAARAAVDVAFHDLAGKKLGVPLHRMLGLSPKKTPLTSFTIGIDSLDVVRKKTREAAEYPVLKVKLGAGNDIEIVRTIREETDALIRVDANAGWTLDEALRIVPQLAELGVELVEQPLPAGDFHGLRSLRSQVDLPIFADESVITSTDVPRLAGCIDGVNIKLMKTGGIREAVRLIHTARAYGMMVMLGCMIETSVAISAAAQLSPLVDFADLDGNLLISNDPYTGVRVDQGRLVLPEAPGIGITDSDSGVAGP